MLKSRNEKAASALGNQAATPLATVSASSTSPATFARTPIVDTIASLAVNPERDAATACQEPNPRGAKSGAIAPPMTARRLSELSSTSPNPSGVKPNPERNHITAHARKRIVPALMMNPLRRSHTCRRTVFALGTWYAGSSITKGAGLPEKGFVFFSIMPERMMARAI